MKNDPTLIVVQVDSELFNMSTCFRKSAYTSCFIRDTTSIVTASSKYKKYE